MTPHKHHDLIVAWAKGAQIQWKTPGTQEWVDCTFNSPSWVTNNQYRVKPEPKPDVVLYAMVEAVSEYGHAKIRSVHADVNKIKSDTCMFVFDGETGKLKKVEVIDEA